MKLTRRGLLRRMLAVPAACVGAVAVAVVAKDADRQRGLGPYSSRKAFARACWAEWQRNRKALLDAAFPSLPPAVCDGLRKAIEQCAALTGRRPDALTMDTKEWVRAGRPTEYLGLRICPRVDCPPDTIYVSNGELT